MNMFDPKKRQIGWNIIVYVLYNIIWLCDCHDAFNIDYLGVAVEYSPIIWEKSSIPSEEEAIHIILQNIKSLTEISHKSDTSLPRMIVWPEYSLYGPNFPTRKSVRPYLEEIRIGVNYCLKKDKYNKTSPILVALSCAAFQLQADLTANMGEVVPCGTDPISSNLNQSKHKFDTNKSSAQHAMRHENLFDKDSQIQQSNVTPTTHCPSHKLTKNPDEKFNSIESNRNDLNIHDGSTQFNSIESSRNDLNVHDGSAQFGMSNFHLNSNTHQECPIDGIWQYNVDVIFHSDGTLVARYRKSHLFYEPAFDQPTKPDPVFWVSSFGVRFGVFICFDIMFEQPVADLYNLYNVRDFVFSSWWVNYPPFLMASPTQAAWASFYTDSNLIAANAGYNWLNSGSGVYSAFNKRFSFPNQKVNQTTNKTWMTPNSSFNSKRKSNHEFLHLRGRKMKSNNEFLHLRGRRDARWKANEQVPITICSQVPYPNSSSDGCIFGSKSIAFYNNQSISRNAILVNRLRSTRADHQISYGLDRGVTLQTSFLNKHPYKTSKHTIKKLENKQTGFICSMATGNKSASIDKCLLANMTFFQPTLTDKNPSIITATLQDTFGLLQCSFQYSILSKPHTKPQSLFHTPPIQDDTSQIHNDTFAVVVAYGVYNDLFPMQICGLLVCPSSSLSCFETIDPSSLQSTTKFDTASLLFNYNSTWRMFGQANTNGGQTVLDNQLQLTSYINTSLAFSKLSLTEDLTSSNLVSMLLYGLWPNKG